MCWLAEEVGIRRDPPILGHQDCRVGRAEVVALAADGVADGFQRAVVVEGIDEFVLGEVWLGWWTLDRC